jgi:molybdopterin molybdotransferase
MTLPPSADLSPQGKPTLSVAEARARILAGLVPTAMEIVPLAQAWRRVSAVAVRARLTQPPADVSAMDGYALRQEDGALGARLRVVGHAPAGHPWDGVVGLGEAIRLFTGSVMPEGASAVVIQEDVDRDGDTIVLREAAGEGRHIRRAGQDFAVGDMLAPAGKRLNARDIGLLAAGNHPWVSVHRRPVVALLATGDEIALPGELIPPGGIVSSNAHALAALVRACGGEPVVLPVAPDDVAGLVAAARGAAGAHLLVTTGGASVGEHDLVAGALAGSGLVLDFWKIAMRPGKPLMAGRLGEVPMVGLPGNPVSALVCAILFLLPAIERLSGLPGDPPTVSEAVLAAPVRANDHRADHLRATLQPGPGGLPLVTPYSRQDSALLRLLTQADALVLRAPHAPALAAGARVEVIRLDALGL